MSAVAWVNALRHADWLHRRRAKFWGLALLVFEAAFLIFLALLQHGAFGPIDKPTSGDFVSFYAAGKLALAGTPALAYDQAAHYLAQQQARVPGAPYQFFFYPPTFLLPCMALATLPYYVAFAVFQLIGLGLFVLVMRQVLDERGWSWLAPVLAFPAVFWTIGLGQNAFWTAALFGGFTLLVDKRPAASGLLLGLLCYKPHFGLLAPVALLAGKRWIAFAAAAATVLASVGVSALLFGMETWLAYLEAFAGSGAVYTSGRIDLAGIVTVFGGVLLMGFDVRTAYIAQAVSALCLAGLVAWVWKRNLPLPLRAATLLTATLLSVPLALLYDRMMLLIAIGWLVRNARDNGFLPWEKLALLAIWPACVLEWPIGAAWRIPVGPMIGFGVLFLCLRRMSRHPLHIRTSAAGLATAARPAVGTT